MSTSNRIAMLVTGIWLVMGIPSFAGETICLEAEAAEVLTPPMRLISVDATNAPEVKEAAGGRCLEIPESAGKPPEVGGDARYACQVTAAADFILWIRVWWLDSCGNSLTVVLDDGKPFAFGQDGTYKSWHWVRGMKVYLPAGRHALKIENREDGVKIDQILLTSVPRYVPVGIESVTP